MAAAAVCVLCGWSAPILLLEELTTAFASCCILNNLAMGNVLAEFKTYLKVEIIDRHLQSKSNLVF